MMMMIIITIIIMIIIIIIKNKDTQVHKRIKRRVRGMLQNKGKERKQKKDKKESRRQRNRQNTAVQIAPIWKWKQNI